MIDLQALGIEGFSSSEEVLGAYLEDNLPVVDNLKIKQLVSSNPELKGLIQDVTSTKIDWNIPIEGDLTLEQFQLPVVEMDNIVENLDSLSLHKTTGNRKKF